MRHLLIPAFLLSLASAAAQTQLTYKQVSVTPDGIAFRILPTGERVPLSAQRLTRRTNLIKMSSRESAGGTVWEMVIDTTVTETIVSDASAPPSPLPPIP